MTNDQHVHDGECDALTCPDQPQLQEREAVMAAIENVMEAFGKWASNLKTRNLAPGPKSDGSIERALDAYEAAIARVSREEVLVEIVERQNCQCLDYMAEHGPLMSEPCEAHKMLIEAGRAAKKEAPQHRGSS